MLSESNAPTHFNVRVKRRNPEVNRKMAEIGKKFSRSHKPADRGNFTRHNLSLDSQIDIWSRPRDSKNGRRVEVFDVFTVSDSLKLAKPQAALFIHLRHQDSARIARGVQVIEVTV